VFSKAELFRAKEVIRIGLRERRKAAGLSLRNIQEITGISKPSMSMYENGKRGLTIKRARILAKVYGCNWKELYDDENDGSNMDSPRHSRAV